MDYSGTIVARLGMERSRQIIEREIGYGHAISGHLRFLYEDAVRRRARNVVELGLGNGESAIALLCAVQATDGMLTSVDVRRLPAAIDKIFDSRLDARWVYAVMDDLAFASNPLARTRRTIDALLVDTNHEREHTEKELRAFAPLMAENGVIWIHDTEPPYGKQVMGAIDAWLPGSGWRIAQRFTHSHGLAVLEREMKCSRGS